jgi:hypothetical protein
MVPNLLSLSIVLFTGLAAGLIWPGSPSPGEVSEYSTANSNSNYSHTVKFLHDNRVDLGFWQWTVRVSEVAANAEAKDYFSGARAAYTT